MKAKLCSGELVVPRDQWPILLYKDYKYDPEDPWKGLLRSSILVLVTSLHFLPFLSTLTSANDLHCRLSSTSSHHLALWKKHPRRLALETLIYMA